MYRRMLSLFSPVSEEGAHEAEDEVHAAYGGGGHVVVPFPVGHGHGAVGGHGGGHDDVGAATIAGGVLVAPGQVGRVQVAARHLGNTIEISHTSLVGGGD